MQPRIPYGRPPEPSWRPIPYRRTTRTPSQQPPASATPSTYRAGWVRHGLLAPAGLLDPRAAVDGLCALHPLDAPLILEIAASAVRVELAVVSQGSVSERAQRALRGVWPQVEINCRDVTHSQPRGLCLVGSFGQRGRSTVAPLRAIDAFRSFDPLNALLEASQPLAEEEQMMLHYLITPLRPERRERVYHQELLADAPPLGWLELLAKAVGRGPKMPRFEPRLQQELEQRILQAPCFELLGLVSLLGSGPQRLRSKARSLSAVLRGSFDTGAGGIEIPDDSWTFSVAADRWRPPPASSDAWLVLTAAELAALFHLPSDQVLVPGVFYLRRPVRPLPAALRNGRGLTLGLHAERGGALPINLPLEDLHAGHLVIPTGMTGVGKTTFLERLTSGLIRSPGRPACILLDIHGRFARALAARGIPPEREGDVLLWEMGDERCPLSLPLFTPPPTVPPEFFSQAIFAALKQVFRESWSSSRLEELLFSLTVTLCSLPGATLLDAPRLLLDDRFRQRAVARLARLDDPVTAAFWHDFERLSPAERRQWIAPVINRLRKFYRSKRVRELLGRAQGLQLSELVAAGGILLVTLDGLAIEAEAANLGELLLTRVQVELMAQPEHRRRRCYLVVDESQAYPGAALPKLFAEGRKALVTVIAATQHLSRWSEELTESILGNVASLVCFRASSTDSHKLADRIRPFLPEHLTNLDRYEAIASLQIDGQTMPAIDIQTLNIEQQEDSETLERIRAQTRARFAKSSHGDDGRDPNQGPTTQTLERMDIYED